ncbi:4Fe-4S dicluster domain-containing protein [Myxococcota bacterium]|nr:4Fe-4S dicluster domain-containing protein [Myxococcota bacterium]MBU1429077.1 4Fe-4S dicluster domain-containing protein [Myxococcota bacterium]MBU1899865.1 4Fe-4S dicluster domain-containing protein [Myxococcota bacterium]
MTRYAMTMDTRRCVGCNACVYACKQENDLPVGGFRDWITTTTRGVFPDLSSEIRSERCNHCDNAPCVYACPTGASHFNEGGVVLVNHDKCTGCKACIAACPYDARYVHPDGFVDKCTFCLHRSSKGLDPACVSICPTESLAFGDLSDKRSVVRRLLDARNHKTLRPETGAGPNVYFLT